MQARTGVAASVAQRSSATGVSVAFFQNARHRSRDCDARAFGFGRHGTKILASGLRAAFPGDGAGKGTSSPPPIANVDVPLVGGATKPLNIIFVATEVAPWSKTGGLGDVVGGLPIELAKRGHHVMSVAPRYDQYADAWDTSVVINIDGEDVRYFHAIQKGVHRVFVDHPWFLSKVWGKTGSKLYGPRSGADFVDNHKRFSLFCKAAVEAARVLPFSFGEDSVFVANDWHSAIVPVLIKDFYQPKGQFTDAKVALCIHNIAFQGRMFDDQFRELQLPEKSFERFRFEDGYDKVYTEVTPLEEDEKPTSCAVGKTFKKINWLKAGITAADRVLTVSPNYGAEISKDEEKGVELDTFIRAAGGAEGIVNGMDIDEWNPKKDKFLELNYDNSSVFIGKAAAKEQLQAEVGLPVKPDVPLFGFIGRLEEQKGVDILIAALPKVLEAGDVQVVVLGTGKAALEKQVAAISRTHPGKAKGIVQFSTPLAHAITAGADYLLIPSRFEPCGLIQLHAMQYGTVPLVSSTGGLVDTVKEGVTGFHMGAFDPDELVEEDAAAVAATVLRAADVYGTPLFKQLVVNAISQDLSWAQPAKKWEAVLEEVYYGNNESTSKKNSVIRPVDEKIPNEKPLAGKVATLA